MTAKEFLNQVKEKDQQIQEQYEYIQRLRDTLDVAGVRYDRDCVQYSVDTDKWNSTIAKIVDLDYELKKLKDEWVQLRIQVLEMIRQLSDFRFRQLLNVVYIDYKSLKDCSEVMGYSYDYIRELHSLALSAFDEMFPHPSP